MSSFSVFPESVAGAGSMLGPIAGEVLQTHGRISGLSGAAAGTPAAGAFDEMIGRWTSVLPHFALAGATLSAALGAAAGNYAATDAGVAAGCEGEER